MTKNDVKVRFNGLPWDINAVEPMYRGRAVAMYDTAIKVLLEEGNCPAEVLQDLMNEKNAIKKLKEEQDIQPVVLPEDEKTEEVKKKTGKSKK